MKKFLLLSIFIFTIFLAGCKDTTPRVFLSTKPITRDAFVPMEEFRKNDTINFVLISPKGFKSETVRLQLLKKSFFSPTWGYTLELGKDYNVEHDNYITGSFTVYSAGRFELMFFDSDGTRKKTVFVYKQHSPRPKPLAVVQFGVYD